MIKNLTKRIPLLIMTLLLTICISNVYLTFIEVDWNFLQMLFVGIFAICLIELICWNRWTFAVSGLLLLLHVFCSLLEVPVLTEIASSVNECAWDTYLKVFWTDRTLFVNEFGSVFLITFVIGLTIHLLYAKFRSVCLSALILIIYIFFMEFYNLGTPNQVMFLLLLMLVALGVLYAQRWYTFGENRQQKKLSLQYGTPLLCSILILCLLLNSVVDKTPNQEFQSWLEQQFEQAPSVAAPEEIELPQFKQSVFEKENGALGGDVSFNNKHQFSVTVNGGGNTTLGDDSVYLRGVACDYFQNDIWHTAIDDGEEKLLSDYFYGNLYFCNDGRASFVQNMLSEGQDFYQERWFTVSYDNNLLPEVLFNHTLTTWMNAYVEDDYGTTTEHIYYDNSTYTYHTSQVNLYDVFYVELNRNSAAFMAEIAAGPATYHSTVLDENLKKQIEDYYLQMPADMSESVTLLAERLTGSYTNDYDKAAAIESYLKENYTYTLKPGDVPEGKNLVEYFLFESQKGYCVYYASSMVMLCRSVGIPARYVKGYRADNITDGKVVSVTDANSHAWVEVLIPNFGWVTFDPVAGNSFQQNGAPNTPDKPTPQKPSPTPAVITPTKAPNGETPTPTTAEPETPTPQTATPTPAVPNTSTPQEGSPAPSDDSTPNKNMTVWWIIGIGGGLILLAVAFFLWKRYAHDKAKTEDTKWMQNAAIRVYRRIVCVYTFLGQAPEVGETVAQYLERLGNRELQSMTFVLEDCFYHQGMMQKDQYRVFMNALQKVENDAMKEKGRLKWKRFRRKFRRKALKGTP